MKIEEEGTKREQSHDKKVNPSKKRVHWSKKDEPELNTHENKKSRRKLDLKYIDPKGYETTIAMWKSYIDKRDFEGMRECCKDIAIKKSEKFHRIRKEYGENSDEAKQFEKKRISYYLSCYGYGHFLFEDACVGGDIEFMKFLASNFTNQDLKINILYREYGNFDLYLSANKHGTHKRKDFIDGLKIFLSITDTTVGAFDYFLEYINNKYRATDEMREDFVTAIKEAKEEGIIKAIDLTDIKSIQDSCKGKHGMTDFSFVDRLRGEHSNQANDLAIQVH